MKRVSRDAVTVAERFGNRYFITSCEVVKYSTLSVRLPKTCVNTKSGLVAVTINAGLVMNVTKCTRWS